jgi:antitoxin component YwqK of YwqJK toxin-antitoxin module
MQEIDYHAGEIDGQYNEWNAEGRQTVKDMYQAGRKLAAKVDYFANKQKKTEGMYLHAKEIEQTPDDWWTVKTATYIKQGKDEKHGLWISWYQNGQKQMQGEYHNDLQVGKFEWWYENGQIALRGSYDAGKQVGKWTWWHSNGQKSTQGEYVDGNPTGRWRWWDTNGRVHETADLSHGDTKVVDVPMPVPHKAEVPSTHPSAPKLQGKIKR